ncbi:MAG: alpha/beta fold hydrolase, partial [Solimonas sp.]
MKFAASDGLEFAYYLDDFSDPWRKADTILLLHSAMGSSHRFYGMVPALARRFKVVRLDLRG